MDGTLLITPYRNALERLHEASDRTDDVAAALAGREVTEADFVEWEAADQAEQDAVVQMFDEASKTLGGIRTLLRYLLFNDDISWDPDDLLDALLRSPVLTVAA